MKEMSGSRDDAPITVSEVEEIASQVLPKQVYDFYKSGSDGQSLQRRNIEDFRRLYILPRVLRDVSEVSTSAELFGLRYSVPIGIAPSAMQRLASERGELDVAQAAVHEQVNFTLSSQSTTTLEDVIAMRPGSNSAGLSTGFWFQIYLTQGLERSVGLIKRAEAAGYDALVLTVDTPVLGNRLNERKTPLVLPHGMRLANLENFADSAQPRTPTRNRLLMDSRTANDAKKIVEAAGGGIHASNLTWASLLAFTRSLTSMKIVLKGIMTPEDAQLAVSHGADAIVVSNHGGRQLDAAPSTIEMLPSIATAVKSQIPIILDGGIRRGADVFKALALGADFVWIGRPVLWGLAYNGCDGVRSVLNILERELSRTMALAGTTSIAQIDKSYLGVASPTVGISKL